MTKKPLITVFTSYYNDELFLAEAIESVLAQTYPHVEYILLNHASTDSSRAVAHRFNDPRIKHLDLPQNDGASGNRLLRHALSHANGEYMKLLSADDLLEPHALEKLWDAAQQNQADLVFGDVAFVDEKNKPLGKTFFNTIYPPNLPASAYLTELLRGVSCFPYAGNLIKTSALRQVPLDTVSVQLADMGLWAALLLQGGKLALTPEKVARYRLHKNQMCSTKNLDVIALRSLGEHALFYQQLLKLSPAISVLKELFPQDAFIFQLTEKDADLFSFALAHALMQKISKPACRLVCRLHIADVLNDSSLATRIEKKFSFTIKDVREEILQHPILLTPLAYPLISPTDKPMRYPRLRQAGRWGVRCGLRCFLRLKKWLTHSKRGDVKEVV